MDFPEKISVVMPTYNTPLSMLKEATDSILEQTFGDFEFIIIDDGSTNESADYLKSLRDRRIRLIRNPRNLGVTKSLNIGLNAAKGKYIARMDADDISLPQRFEKQYAFMEAHPDVIMCGCEAKNIGEKSETAQKRRFDQELYRIKLLFENPGPRHPTLFIRREALKKHHISYDESLIYAQDYGLLTSLAEYGRIGVISDVLVSRREHAGQISVRHRELQLQCHKQILKRQLRGLLENVTDEEVDLHDRYYRGRWSGGPVTPEMLNWYERLIKANDTVKKYDAKKFRAFVYQLLMIMIRTARDLSAYQKLRMILRRVPLQNAVQEAAAFIGRKITHGAKHLLYTPDQD